MKAPYSNGIGQWFCRGVAVSLLAMLAACGGDPVPEGEMASGQEPYLRYCASCHGNQGEGKRPSFPPVAGSEWLDLPSEALALIVLRGLRGEIQVKGERYRGFMPPMGHMSDADIAAVIGYMEETWTERQPDLSAADVARIRRLAREDRQPLDGLEGVREALDAVRNPDQERQQ